MEVSIIEEGAIFKVGEHYFEATKDFNFEDILTTAKLIDDEQDLVSVVQRLINCSGLGKRITVTELM